MPQEDQRQGDVPPDELPLPTKFVDAYRELQEISEKLRVREDAIPDIDAIGPLVRRAQKLSELCEERIANIRKALATAQPGG
ncbi:MAG TPA: hypothetical protein VNZ61_21625 [Roseomonas sp.]|nr:hypothetical protein [Roseomonas sp.]